MFKQVLKAEQLEWLQESLQQKYSGLNAIIKTLRIQDTKKLHVSCSTLAQSESELPELPWFVVLLTTSE